MTRPHRQSYELLPSGVPEGRREPRARVAALLIVVALLTVTVTLAAWSLMGQSIRPQGAEQAAPTGGTRAGNAAPVPLDDVTYTPARTIVASGLTTISPDIMLPHEEDPAWTGANLKLDTCDRGEPERTVMDQAIDIRSVIHQTEAGERSETLLIAANDSAANSLYNRLANAMSACVDPTATTSTPQATRTTVLNQLDDGRHLATDWERAGLYVVSWPAVERGEPRQSSYVLLARMGRALIIGAAYGTDVPAPSDTKVDAGTAAMLQSFADAMAPKVCVYRDSGCGPFPPPPPPTPEFPLDALLMDDGNVLLPDGTILDPTTGLPPGEIPPPPTPTAAPS